MAPGKLSEAFVFDAPSGGKDAFGGPAVGWSEQFERRCAVIYQKGSEAVEAARLAGRAVFKVKLRNDSATRQITTDWRARDTRRGDLSGEFPGVEYNIVEVDAITDRAWVYLVIEGPVV